LPARFYVDPPLLAPTSADADFALSPGAARHVQVLRLQPGDALSLFDGSGPEWQAEVTAMGRHEVRVRLLHASQPERELRQAITLAVVMPANDRMDALVEKATELGAAAIQPLMSERSVLRLTAERADKKCAHWRGVAIAAAEQCGRTRPTQILPVQNLPAWLADLPPAADDEWRGLLSPGAATPLGRVSQARALFLSGPEGGLSPAEEEAARACGFNPIQLGPRILRADTAPLAVLAVLAVASLNGPP
jgi:16S rRNA (uracil1498-N3)-methyltransferase